MPFREKRAWLSLLCIGLVASIYYYYLFSAYIEDRSPQLHSLTHMALIAILVFIGLRIVLFLGLNFFSSAEDKMPRDERELSLERKATGIAYVAFMVLSVMASAVIIHHPGNVNWLMGNVVILAAALAEMIKYTAQIVFYRRGI